MSEIETPYKKRNGTSLLPNDLGKIPPQAIEVEKVILGALMLEKDAIHETIGILTPECFYKDEHKEIFSAIRALTTIDVITVTNELRNRGKLEFVGGAFYISELTNRVGSAANIQYHCFIIKQKHILRELISTASQMQKDAFEESEDTLELLQKATLRLIHLNNEISPAKDRTLAEISIQTGKEILEASKTGGKLLGVPTGFVKIDRRIGGLKKGCLILIAARPGMGKTSLALSIARNAATIGHKGAILSLEMTDTELFISLASIESEIENNRVRSGDLYPDENIGYQRAIGRLEKLPILIDDTSTVNEMDFRAKITSLVAKHNIEWAILDFIQLMGSTQKTNSQNEKMSNISRALKLVAKDLRIPIVALSQLSREVEKRNPKRPQLSDLRDSGTLEENSDQVIFIYRPEYYGDKVDEDGNSLKGVAEIIVAKNRGGATGSEWLNFVGEYTKFSDMDNYNSVQKTDPF